MEKLYAKIRLIDYGPCALKELSEIYCRVRDETGEGASTFHSVNIKNPDGYIVGHIAYNGRIFAGPLGFWTAATKLLYENRTAAA